MKILLTRLKETRGETLIESMIAILIFTFASILFLTLVTSAANINTTVKEADERFQAQQEAVEKNETSTESATVTLKKGDTDVLSADDYTNFVVTDVEDGALYAYFLQEGGAGT